MGLCPSGDKLIFNPLWHILSILLTSASFIMLMVVMFNNAPLDHGHSTLEGKSESRMWLLVVNETSNTLVFDHSNKRSDVYITEIRSTDENNEEHSNTEEGDFHTTDQTTTSTVITEILGSPKSNAKRGANSGIHAYGFGIWGWCGWSDKNWTGHAKCTKKVFWSLPKNALPTWDNIDQIMKDLPNAITHALSITSFFLLFSPFLILSYWIMLLLTIRFEKPYPPWPVPPKSKWPKDLPSTKTKIAWIIKDWRTNLVFFILMIILVVPCVITVLVGKSGIKKDIGIGGALKASTGYGFDL
ncbi:uncharacterized protein L201_000390 [Kwoniella dendrophila CBS 6074]|uniref:Uncharacterized protein n=1 Tax=Kwoniella dendrophila CBS 6074 TaxID=1295534 RepID=A0AAX4JJC3_9TREE